MPTSRGFQMETSQRRKLLMFSFLYFLFTVSLFVNRILMMNYGHVMMWNSHVQTRFYAVVRNWWEIRIARWIEQWDMWTKANLVKQEIMNKCSLSLFKNLKLVQVLTSLFWLSKNHFNIEFIFRHIWK